MTKEDKELLLKDLSARLPYNVEIHIKGEYKTPRTIFCIHIEDKTVGYFKGLNYNEKLIENIKPYLRPMSNMTEEEKEEFENLLEGIVDGIERWDKPDLCEEYDWLNSHYFDYRGLIEKGLALEAPNGMYDLENK